MPLMLKCNSDQDQTDRRADDGNQDDGESHLRLENAVVPSSQALTDQVVASPAQVRPDNVAQGEGEIRETLHAGRKAVRRGTNDNCNQRNTNDEALCTDS
jgi:hypothetical protein